MKEQKLSIAMISIHSSPTGDLGTRDTGGMSVFVRELSRELGRCGHRVDIYTRSLAAADKETVALSKNVRLIHIAVPGTSCLPKEALYPYLHDFFLGLEAFRKREGLQYEVIYSHYWLSGCLGTYAQASWGIPHLTTFHTLGLLKNISGNGYQESALRIAEEEMLVKTCSRVLVGAEREQKNLNRYYHVPQYRIGIVPCGVDPKLFRPLNKAAVRRSLGFRRDEKIVLYVGRIDPLKGITLLLESLPFLQKHPLRLVVIGGDDQTTTEGKKLRALARDLNIHESVSFAGRVDQKQLPRYYNAADALVVPSLYESFGIVALESLACGTPVIATPVGAMERIIQNNKNGLIVKKPTPAALARAIRTLIIESPAACRAFNN